MPDNELNGDRSRRLQRIDTHLQNWLRQHRWGAAVTALGAVLVFALGSLAYGHWAPNAPQMIGVELAGSVSTISDLVKGQGAAYAHALSVDYVFIAAYGLVVFTGAMVGRSIAFTRTARRLSTAAIAATAIAVLCDVAENELLRPVVRNPHDDQNGLAVAAQAVSVTKWVLILPAASVALVAVLTTLWRAVGVTVDDHVRNDIVELPAVDEDEQLRGRTGGEAIRHSAWRANSRLPSGRVKERREDEIGFCVSGGGIRSATFALGAMDALRAPLRRARYLVSVSGGGYATGAMQLALQKLQTTSTLPDDPKPSESSSAAAPADVYTGGSAELDHTRKHGRYLADGAAEWTVAVVSILRGLLVNLFTLSLLTVVLGRVAAHLYAYFPGSLLQKGWPPPAGVSWAVGVAFALSVAIWVLRIWVAPAPGRRGATINGIAAGFAGLGALLAVLGIGFPLIAWVAGHPPGAPAVTGAAVSVLAAWVAAIVALGKRPAMTKNVQKVWELWTKASPKTRSKTANLVVAAALLLIAAALLLLLAIMLANTNSFTAPSEWPGRYDEWVYSLAAAAVLAFFATVDQVRWSLHPFYRRRLATAFAVRRVRDRGRVRAVRYDFDTEATALHSYAQRHENTPGPPDFPQLIFSCAAHDSDPRVSLPGRRVVPWSMSGDYVGSPMIGWVPSRDLHDAVGRVLQADLTVQAAQAISGAAIASEMGRMHRAYSRLLTLTNARLGSWLPNPAYLHRRGAAKGDGWWLPRLPRRRYLSTLARELFGSFPGDGPLLYVTDGGHYENLGLVELLRHRPALAFCLDGSGDRPDVATTFAQAIQLAYEELGVVVTPERPGGIGAGAAGPPVTAPDPLIGELKERLAQSCVVTSRIVYPDLGPGLPPREGLLFLGKATLTAATPFEVLAHAARNPSFPNDSTADQWFDFAQFDAYHALGRYVGEETLASVRALAIPPARTTGLTISLRTQDGRTLLIDVDTGPV